MSIAVEGLKGVVRRKTFNDIACGSSFVGSFRGRFGVWHKAGELDLVGLSEEGYMDVYCLKKDLERYDSIFNYTKVELRVSVEAIAEHPGGR